MEQPNARSRHEERFDVFSASTRVVRTALASVALLVLGTVAAPAANAYNPDIDGDGVPNTWEMKGYDADGDGKIDDEPVEADLNRDGEKTILTAPNDMKNIKFQATAIDYWNYGANRSEEKFSGEIEKNEMTADRARAEGLVPAKD